MSSRGPKPYLLMPGSARAALEFWGRVFGGEVTVYTLAEFGREDGPAEAVAHGILAGDVELYAADATGDDKPFAGEGVLFSLLGIAPREVLHRWFDALGDGGTVLDRLQVRPWGASDGQVRDRFGVTWLIGYEAEEG
ncbi:glyoxalase [Frondihabitans sp. PAMC 28766]|uniref:VOC family protein n=1 Tax=Frondihabitans sp. PAMC 28766 TaxID=1795630 RepID=UPI00078E70BB|nr:VOC family protein [Frondihabitans sp. PAMC 28766]AMM19950.1 glyoxalase [Frondihabitans sp. PAMC 28766]